MGLGMCTVNHRISGSLNIDESYLMKFFLLQCTYGFHSCIMEELAFIIPRIIIGYVFNFILYHILSVNMIIVGDVSLIMSLFMQCDCSISMQLQYLASVCHSQSGG